MRLRSTIAAAVLAFAVAAEPTTAAIPGPASGARLAAALALVADGRPEEASDELERLREEARGGEDPWTEGLALWGLAAARIEQGRPAEARQLAAAARGRFEAAGDAEWRDRAAVWEQWAAALDQEPGLDTTLLRVALLEELVPRELELLRFGDSVRHADAALSLLEGQDQPAAEAGFRMYRGMGLTGLQQLEAAEADLDRASAELADGLRQVAPPDGPDPGLLATMLPKLVLGAGTQEWGPGLEHLEQMGEAYRDLLPPWMLRYLEMVSLMQEERFSEAQAACRDVQEEAAAHLPEDHRSSVEVLCRLAGLLSDWDDEEAVVRGFAELLPLLSEQLAEMPDAAQGPLGVLLGQFAALVQNPDERDRWVAETDLGEGIEALQDGVAEAAPAELRGELDSAIAPIAELFVSIKSGAGDAAAAFDLAEQMRTRELLDRMDDARLATRGAGEAAERIAGLRARRRDLEGRLGEIRWRAPSSPEEAEVRGELDGVRRELQATFHRLALEQPAEPRRRPLSLGAVQEALDPETTLVAFLTFASGTDATLAWVVTRSEVRLVSLSVRAGELAEEVSLFIETLRHREPVDRLAESVYRRLWAPLREHVRTRRVLLVPHGPLQELPFAALRDPDTGRWLVEDATLLHAPSATVWARLAARPAGGAPPLVLGDPEGNLPAAAEEARAVAALWGIRPLLGPDATEEALRSRAAGASLVHVSAHGVVSPQDPLFTRLRLAPSSGHLDNPARDGRLEVHEVMTGLDLSGTGLVVLPACHTGEGPRTRGDEVTSLARAFLLAGARSAVTTAWAVDDDSTAALMVDFHRRLAAGDDAAEALRQAQEAALASPGRAHPWHWAGLSIHGAGGPVAGTAAAAGAP